MARPLRVALLAAAALVVVVPAAFVVFREVVQPGDPPSFYDPPDALPAGPPGTIIRAEELDEELAPRSWRVLYTSTGLDGEPTAVSAIIAAPDGPAPAGGWPVVAWAHGTTGVASRCAPSLVYDHHGLGRVPELTRLLDAGNVVVITDYPGLGTPGPHPYLVNDSEGRAVLDAVRTANGVLPGEISPTTAVFGHSQGGHATLAAAALAADYAPELRVVGAAPMAPPTALGELLDDDVDEIDGIVLGAFAVASWAAVYPEADEDAVVRPVARPIVRDLAGLCAATTGEGLSAAPDVIALKAGFLSADPSDTPGWRELLAENSAGDASTTIPLLVTQGLTDDLVRPAVTQAYVDAQSRAVSAWSTARTRASTTSPCARWPPATWWAGCSTAWPDTRRRRAARRRAG